MTLSNYKIQRLTNDIIHFLPITYTLKLIEEWTYYFYSVIFIRIRKGRHEPHTLMDFEVAHSEYDIEVVTLIYHINLFDEMKMLLVNFVYKLQCSYILDFGESFQDVFLYMRFSKVLFSIKYSIMPR